MTENPTSSGNEGQPRRFTRNRLSRGRGLRKTTGCLTCRRRRVKCNEAKPICGGCAKRKVECVYESSDAFDEPSKADRSSIGPAPEGQPGEVDAVAVVASEAAGRPPPYAYAAEPVPSPGAPVLYQASDGYLEMQGESPTAQWLGLLIGDAGLQMGGSLPGPEFDSGGLNVLQHPFPGSSAPVSSEKLSTLSIGGGGGGGDGGSAAVSGGKPRTRNASLMERHWRSEQLSEREAWHSAEPIQLPRPEAVLFQHFVQHISQWFDLFEPNKPFGTLVPHLAVHNVGLMNAILALSSRHLSILINGSPSDMDKAYHPGPNDAVRFYYKALHYSQEAMQFETYKVSLELLAISMVISTYEMLDGSSRKDWERHLKGVFWIQRSQVIHGDSGGLRQGVWWTWLGQDVWAAFREKRRPFTFWQPERDFDALGPWELAARAVWLFAHAVGFCSTEDVEEDREDVARRMSKADQLVELLGSWERHLTVEFEPLPVPADPDSVFPRVWIQPAAFAVSMQLYYCSLILVTLHRPRTDGLAGYLEQKGMLKRCVHMVCGIASTLNDYASAIMSSQCVYIAGMMVETAEEQTAVLQILDDCRRRGKWPVQPLGDELERIWQR